MIVSDNFASCKILNQRVYGYSKSQVQTLLRGWQRGHGLLSSDSRTCGKADQHFLQTVSCQVEQAVFRIVIMPSDEDRRQYLLLLDKRIAEDTDQLENVITALGRKGGPFTADDVTSAFHGEHRGLFFSFLHFEKKQAIWSKV